MPNKRGVSGLEVAISFAIFVTFVIAIFIYFNPINMPVTNSFLTILESSVKNNASISVNTIPFSMNRTVVNFEGADCFVIPNPFGAGANLSVTDEFSNNVAFQKSGDNLLIRTIASEKFYNINNYSNSDIDAKSANLACAKTYALVKDATRGDYNMSIPRTEQVYYLGSLLEMNKTYYAEYSALKGALKMPSASDFSVIVLNASMDEIVSMKKTFPKANILSKEFPVEILSINNGAIKIIKGYLRLLVW